MSDHSKDIVRVQGGTGAATTIATINNMLEQVHLACAAEAIALAAKVGLDIRMVFQIIVDAA